MSKHEIKTKFCECCGFTYKVRNCFHCGELMKIKSILKMYCNDYCKVQARKIRKYKQIKYA